MIIMSTVRANTRSRPYAFLNISKFMNLTLYSKIIQNIKIGFISKIYLSNHFELLSNSKIYNSVFDWSSTFHRRAVDLKCMEINSSRCVDTIWCQICQNPISINEERCHSYFHVRRLVDVPSTSYRLENIITRQISSSRCFLVPSLSPYGIRRRRTVPRKITNFTSTEFADGMLNIFCPRALQGGISR